MTDATETRDAVIAGAEAAKIEDRVTDVRGIPVALLNRDQSLKVCEDAILAAAKREPMPARKRGRSSHHRLDSFVAHVNRNKVPPFSALWANVEKTEVSAIYNYHGPQDAPEGVAGLAGWCDYSARYSMPLADQWLFWTARAGKAMSQGEFADLIDERMADLASGEGFAVPAELLELARNLRIHTEGTFRRSMDPTTGESALVCKTEHTQNSTPIPRAFALGIPVFRAGAAYHVECRVRFRLQNGVALFSFEIHRQADILLDAFSEAVDRIAKLCEDVPVFWGVPEAAPDRTLEDAPR